MEQFLRDNVSGIFTIVGVLISSAMLLIASWIQSRREVQYRLAEKLLDRRLSAHESVILLAQEMRKMESLGYVDEEGEIARFPSILRSEGAFRKWYDAFLSTMAQHSTWLATSVLREMNLLQDYSFNLFRDLNGAPDEVYPQVGLLIRQDFIDFSMEIENRSRHFLTRDLPKLRLGDLGEWHKYPIEETDRRITKTKFLQNRDRIASLVKTTSITASVQSSR